jgi:tRNA A-37 threonylcarbamoyl transferase component Bud32
MRGRKISPEQYINGAKNDNFESVSGYLQENAGNAKAINIIVDNQCALHEAILKGNHKILSLLIDAGADVNICVNRVSALHLAAIDGDAALVKQLLLAKGIKVNAKNQKKESALFQAVKYARIENVLLLLLAGADYKSVIKKFDSIAIVKDDIKKLFDAFQVWENLRKKITKNRINISDDDLNLISKLSVSKFERLIVALNDLQNIGQLNQDSFARALEFVSAKSSNRLYSKLLHRKSEGDNKFQCEFDNGHKLYCWEEPPKPLVKIESKDAEFRRGYSDSHETSPVSVVKRYRKSGLRMGYSPEKTAKREAKYLQITGRKTAFWSKDDDEYVYVISDWVRGKSMSDLIIDRYNFSHLSMNQRFNLLVSLFEDVKRLHDNNAVHRNINPENVMLSVTDKTMCLIEMDAAGKIGKQHLKDANRYRDIYSEKYGAMSDMYSLGYIVAMMFPELFVIQEEINSAISYKYVLQTKQSSLNNLEIAAALLRAALMHEVPGHRCTVNQALQFCKKIVEKLGYEEQIAGADLFKILGDTINRKHFEVEDGFLGSSRPKYFANGGDQSGGYAEQLGLNRRISRGSAKGLFANLRLSGSARRAQDEAELRVAERAEQEQQEILLSHFGNNT